MTWPMKKLTLKTLTCMACNKKIATWLMQVPHEDIKLNLCLCEDCVKKSVKELIETQKYKG